MGSLRASPWVGRGEKFSKRDKKKKCVLITQKKQSDPEFQREDEADLVTR